MASDGKSPVRRESSGGEGGGGGSGGGGGASVKALESKVDHILQVVSEMQSKVLSLSLAHSLSHVQTIERVEALAARVDLVYERSGPGNSARPVNGGLASKSSPKSLPKVPGMQSSIPGTYAVQPGKKPSYLTQSLEVELTLVSQ
jgi:hypothetical protein